MIRRKWIAVCISASALICGNAFGQVVGDWTGDSTTNFDDSGSWYQGVVPFGTIVMRFSPDFSTGGSGSNLTMDVAGSALGIDVESGMVSGSGNISIGGTGTLTLGTSGIAMNQTFQTAFSIADIIAPLKLAATQSWNITNSDLIVFGPISQTTPGTALTIAVSGSANITLSSASSTFSGGVTLTGGAGAVLVVGASTTGPGGAPTQGPLGTGTLTLAGGTEVTTPSESTITLANNIMAGPGTETLQGALGGGLVLTGTIAGPGIIQAPTPSSGSVDFEGDNTFSGGTVLFYATVTIGNDHGLGVGPVSAANNTLYFTSNFPGIGIPSFSFNQSTANFTMPGGEPTLANLSMFDTALNFSSGSVVSITDMTSDAPGSTNVISLGNTSAFSLRIDGTTAYYGTITGPNTFMGVTTGGTGILDLYGANTYSGGTTIHNNVLVIADNNTALGTGPGSSISLNGGGASLGVGSGITITNSIGSVSGGSNIEGYGTISPGNVCFIDDSNGSVFVGGKGSLPLGGFTSLPVPGTLTFGGENAFISLGNNGIMQFSIMNATGVAGTDFSTISAPNNDVAITAIPAHPFTIQLVSVNPATGQVGLANFNSGLAYSWTLLSAQSITGFSANDFTVDDTTKFQNSIGGGAFSVSLVGGDDLTLNFTPVPEPSTWALMATGLCALGAAARRRRS